MITLALSLFTATLSMASTTVATMDNSTTSVVEFASEIDGCDKDCKKKCCADKNAKGEKSSKKACTAKKGKSGCCKADKAAMTEEANKPAEEAKACCSSKKKSCSKDKAKK